MVQQTSYTDDLRIATNKASDAIRRRIQIQLGLTKHQSEESANAEIKILTKVIKSNWNRTVAFLSKKTVKGISYRELPAQHIYNILRRDDIQLKYPSFYADMEALRNYNNALTT